MRVLARIKLLHTEDGGRKDALIGPFRLNHSFQEGEFVIGQVELGASETLAPGQSADLIVNFLADTAPALTTGTEWRIFDGPRHLVGRGTVLEVLSR